MLGSLSVVSTGTRPFCLGVWLGAEQVRPLEEFLGRLRRQAPCGKPPGNAVAGRPLSPWRRSRTPARIPAAVEDPITCVLSLVEQSKEVGPMPDEKRAPLPAHDPYEEYELPVDGFQGTADEIERQWYEKCYVGRGDTVKQLTWRAVIMGWALGGVLSLTNIYIGLKAGWAFGVAITACILSYAIWTGFHRMKLVRTQMTILENNCMQSTASAAGYSTGGTLISAFAAYILINNQTLPLSLMLGWVFFVAILGVTMAVPMKRQMINVEQLRFPSGIAAAETLRALHAKGEKGMRAARALGIGGILAALSAFLTDGLRLINPRLESLQISSLVTRDSMPRPSGRPGPVGRLRSHGTRSSSPPGCSSACGWASACWWARLPAG